MQISSGTLIYALAVGVAFGTAVSLSSSISLLMLGTCLFGVVVFLFLGKKSPRALLGVIVLSAAILATLRVEMFERREIGRDLSSFAGEILNVQGVVVNDPERRETSVHAHIEVSEVDGLEAGGKVLVLFPRETEVYYGETVEVRGTLELPESFETETGRVFDYPAYLRVRGISVLMRYAEIEQRTAAEWSIPGTLYAFKHTFASGIERVFAEPSASLLEGLLLGERRGLPEQLTEAFIVTGLVHVVVLSGYNISIVAEAVLRVFSFLPRALNFAAGGATILLFVVMVGTGATAVRALLMGLIAILARYFGRAADALRALALAAALMILWNPLSLLHDPSFILSVLATFGLVTLSGSIEQKLPLFLARVPQIRSIAASTLGVQAFVLPALLYMTGILSFVSLPANILALPAVPLAMASGFIAGLVALIHSALALPFAMLAELPLRFIVYVATSGAAFPYASSVVEEFPFWVAAVAYVPLSLLAIWLYVRNETQVHSS